MILPGERTYNCAHRGASGQAPENTLGALERALALGADMAEADLRLTADGLLALIHDATLERTTSGHGRVADRTMVELAQLDAGSWFEPAWHDQRVPALGEALSLARGRLRLNLELKADGRHEAMLDELLRQLARHDMAAQCVVTSFDADLIDELKARAPHVAAGYIFGPGDLPGWAFSAKVEVLSAEQSLVDAAFCEFATAAGKSVHVWTVDEPAAMRHFAALGVDAVITNHPERWPLRA
ncbi:MAG: glycerophosphodiester phosphodiesterase [bacterium]|nr:glycerophosphodiester phosphodiesterase [bacterium]